MAKSKNEKSKITAVKVGGNGTPEKTLQEKVSDVTTEKLDENLPEEVLGNAPQPVVVEKLSLKSLRKEAVELGMPEEDAKKFNDAELLQSTVNTLKAVKASVTNPVDEAVNPKEEKEIEQEWRSKADRQKAYFDSLPKVRILIPCEGEEKPGVIEERIIDGRKQTVVVSGAVWSKTFNGYRVIVPKGVYTVISEAIADNIAQEFNQVQESNARFSVDRIDPKTGKSVNDQL